MNINNGDFVKLANKCRQISTESNLAVFVDINHKIVYVDAQLEETTGYDKDELIGEDLNILIPRDMHHVHKNNIEKFASDELYARTMSRGRGVRLRKKNNESVPVEITLHRFDEFIQGKTILAAVMIPLTQWNQGDKYREITETTTIDDSGRIRQFKSITEYVNSNWQKVRLVLIIISLGFILYHTPNLLERYFEYRIQIEQQKNVP